MKRLILFALLLICLDLPGEITKISVSLGQSTLVMEDFNKYLQNNMIPSQMNFEKIETGTSINIGFSKSIKRVKDIDFDLSLGYLSASTSGSADSLLWWEYTWQSGQKTDYNLYALPVMLTVIYNVPLNNYFSSKLNLSFGTGISFNFGMCNEKIQILNLDGTTGNTLSNSRIDDSLGYHLSSILSYNINDTFHIGVKGLYRKLNFPKMDLPFDSGSELGLDFSGYEINLFLGINFSETEN